jgi:cohesin complex subunit SA-1/2
MPAKKVRVAKESGARRGASSAAAAAPNQAGEEKKGLYDVASLPLDDAASSSAATPQSSLSPPQKRAKKESLQSSAPDAATSSGVAAGDVSLTTTTTLPQQPVLGETAEASLAESTLQLLVDGAAPAEVTGTVLAVYRGGAKEQALCAILNVVAKASGVAEVELDANALVDGVEIRPLLEELYNRVPEDSEAYLLVNKDAKYRRFRRTFPEWCSTLVHDAFAADVVLDATFLPVLSQWLMAMSECKSRSFRHTATVTLLAFVYALSGVAADLQNQLALLRAKKDVAAVQRKRDDVVEWRDHLFSQAVHQRLRDVAPDIRLSSFQALRRWILEFPDEFMTNKYLRYLGMPLHDKRPELRAEALDTILQALAHVPDAYSRMHLFLQYFTTRLVELSSDVDVRCTELAIRVVAMMVRGDSDVPDGSELLSNEKIDEVLLTLFDERPTVRAAAGILLKVFIHCRTAGEESEAEQIAVATELLCSFAATLRSQYRETMPEKYLIDALWTPERPPVLLTEYQPILAAAQSDKPMDAVVGLQLLAALLLKLQGKLTLGPLPKDDRRGGGKKLSPKAREEAEVLQRRLSEDAAFTLCTILEIHRGSEDVLQAAALLCAALDMTTFTSQRHHTALSALLIELRKVTLLSPCVAAETRESLVKAWYQLAFTDHPLRTEAQAHLQELLKNVLSHFARVVKRGARSSREEEGEETLAVWGRMNLVSALVPTQEHWPSIYAALRAVLGVASTTDAVSSHTAAATPMSTRKATVELLAVGTAVNSLLWWVKASSENADAAALPAELKQHMTDLITAVLTYEVEMEERAQSSAMPATTMVSPSTGCSAFSADRAHWVLPVAETFVFLCDLLALPYCDLSQVQQETLVRLLRGLHEQTSVELRTAQDYLKLHVQDHRALQQQQRQQQRQSDAGRLLAAMPAATGLAELVAARRTCSRLEALQLRLVTGVARLFLFKRLEGNTLAAPVLVLWTQSPSKAVADTFKSLFHTLRDRAGDDGFSLERDVVLTAYNNCVEVGATPVSVEALYQTGAKLASLHFGVSDRFYACCPAMVRLGADFATSTDPMLLQAIIPYASKLRPVDALHVLRDQLSKSDIFAEGSNPYVRAFVAALRKAAKLEDSSSLSLMANNNNNSSSSGKRPRALGGPTELAEEEGMLAAIAQGLPDNAGALPSSVGGRAGGARGQRISVASRVVTADGWHVPASAASQNTEAEEDVVEVERSQNDPHHQQQHASAVRSHRSIINVPTTQETALSSLADGLDSGEVFVATEEYE